MTTTRLHHFVDAGGSYLGASDDPDALPAGASEVPSAPADGRQHWNGAGWDPLPAAIGALAAVVAGDGQAFRLLEVLVDVLLAKGVILATDFPVAVRQLYQARKVQRATAGLP